MLTRRPYDALIVLSALLLLSACEGDDAGTATNDVSDERDTGVRPIGDADIDGDGTGGDAGANDTGDDAGLPDGTTPDTDNSDADDAADDETSPDAQPDTTEDVIDRDAPASPDDADAADDTIDPIEPELVLDRSFTFGTDSFDYAIEVTVGLDKTLYLAGNTNGTIDPLGTPNAGSSDVFVQAITTDLDPRWSVQIGTSEFEEVADVVAHPEGGLVLLGRTRGGLALPSAIGNYDYFLARIDSAGNRLWTTQFGTSELETDGAVALLPDGRIAVAGTTRGSLPGQASSGELDGVIFILDATGNVTSGWLVGSDRDDRLTSLVVADGNLLVSGFTQGVLYNEVARDPSCATTSVCGDAVAASYTPAGAANWALQYGTPLNEIIWEGVGTEASGLYAGGYTVGAAWPGFVDRGQGDMVVSRISGTGLLEWVWQEGSSRTDTVQALASLPSGVIVVGNTQGTIEAFDNSELTPGEGQNVTLAFLSRDGELVDALTWGSGAYDHTVGVTVVDEYIFAFGYTGGPMAGVPLAGGYDGFITRFTAPGILD